MDRTNIADSRDQLQSACEDLKALRSIVKVVEAQPDWPNEREMLTVVFRTLQSVISDMQASIDSISDEISGKDNVR